MIAIAALVLAGCGLVIDASPRSNIGADASRDLVADAAADARERDARPEIDAIVDARFDRDVRADVEVPFVDAAPDVMPIDAMIETDATIPDAEPVDAPPDASPCGECGAGSCGRDGRCLCPDGYLDCEDGLGCLPGECCPNLTPYCAAGSSCFADRTCET